MLARLDRPGAFWVLFGALGACVGTAFLAAAAAHARFDAPLGHAAWFALLGAIFAAGGGGVLWRALSERRRVARVARDGIDVVAEITGRDPLG